MQLSFLRIAPSISKAGNSVRLILLPLWRGVQMTWRRVVSVYVGQRLLGYQSSNYQFFIIGDRYGPNYSWFDHRMRAMRLRSNRRSSAGGVGNGLMDYYTS